MTTERGTIIFVCRNGLPLTRKAVATAVKQDMPCDVILIDNASTDGTAQWLCTQPHIRACFLKQHSLAYCWNYALRIAWQMRDHALVCNTDVELRPDTYRLLLAHGGEFVTCVSVDDRDRMGITGDRSIDSLRAGQRLFPDFSCYLIRQSVTDNIGWFDEECYPGFTEDNRFHIRMWRGGIRAVCLDVPFYHIGSATIKNATPAERAEIQRGADTNRERFRQLYGCVPGSVDYEALFDESSFGVDKIVTTGAKPFKIG